MELVIAGLTGGGVTEAIRALARRRRERVDSTVTLNDQAMKFIQSVQKDADDSRAEAEKAYQTLREYRQQTEQELGRLVSELNKHRQLAEELTYRFRVLTSAIMSPNASVESLRDLVTDPYFGGHNKAGG